MYLKRHWADGDDGDVELSSTPALESAQSDFYYVPRNRLYGDEMHIPENVLMAAADESIGLFAGVEEAQFRNERYEREMAPAPAPSRALRRSRSAAAAHAPMPPASMYYNNHVDIKGADRRRSFCEPEPTPSRLSRRRSFAAPTYYRMPITGGGEYTLPSQKLRPRRNPFQATHWVAVISAKNHKRQRRKRQSATAKREKSQTPKFLTAILT